MQENDLRESLDKLGLDVGDFPNLQAAFDRSCSIVLAARSHLAESFKSENPDIDVVAFGSLARHEMTTESDLDYLVVVYKFDENPGTSRRALAIAEGLPQVLSDGGHDVRPPGSTGVFGKMVSAIDLVEVIGLESDTNHSHTRRILFLEESVSLYNPEQHRHLLESIVRRYLDVKPFGSTKLPRFLMNDLARYWRTLTIDYQAKTPDHSAHSLRYLKLITSRKFTYASSILPLLVLGVEGKGAEIEDPNVSAHMAARLVQAYSLPPVIRFIDAATSLVSMGEEADPDLLQHVRRVLEIIEEVNGKLGDSGWRKTIEEQNDYGVSEEFEHVRSLGLALQNALEEIFFSRSLQAMTRKYLVF